MSEIREVQAAMRLAGAAMRMTLAQVNESMRLLTDALMAYAADRAIWQAQRYGQAQMHYGVRRVTARQYRAWKRMQGRRR